MRKSHFYFLGIVIVLILTVGYVIYLKPSVVPERILRLMLPESWALSVEKKTAPTLWKGNPECKFVKLENPSEKYFEPDGEFNYSARHNFWFCPKNWAGDIVQISPTEQRYAAKLLCECKNFKIFHLSLGENSQKNLPEKVKIEFDK